MVEKYWSPDLTAVCGKAVGGQLDVAFVTGEIPHNHFHNLGFFFPSPPINRVSVGSHWLWLYQGCGGVRIVKWLTVLAVAVEEKELNTLAGSKNGCVFDVRVMTV